MFLVPSKMYVNANWIYDDGWGVFNKIVLIKLTTYKFYPCWLDVEILADPCELPVVDPPVLEHALKIEDIIWGGKCSRSNKFYLNNFSYFVHANSLVFWFVIAATK